MSDEEEKPDMWSAQLDQALTDLENLAKSAGEFKKYLMAAGITHDVAEEMVREYFAGMFRK